MILNFERGFAFPASSKLPQISRDLIRPLFILMTLPSQQSHHVFTLTSSGAIWADLVPTVILLAIYFCIADFVLIGQCLYYNHINAKSKRHASIASAVSEEEPLLSRRRSSDATGLPGSHRRRSSAQGDRNDTLAKILEVEESDEGNAWLRNSLSILGVIAVGTAGWAIAWQSSVWKPTPEGGDVPVQIETALGAKLLGYTSAVCYLG